MQKRLLGLIALLGMVILTGCGPTDEGNNPDNSVNSQTTAEITVENGNAVQISYLFKFDNGEIWKQGESSFIVGQTDTLGVYKELSLVNLVGAKVGEVLRGELTSEQTLFADDYDVSKKQSLAIVYFDELGFSPSIGMIFNLPGMGTGEVIEKENLDNGLYYLVDFNDPATRKTMNYEITILNLQK